MSVGKLGGCSGSGKYRDGGAVEFEKYFTVNNWRAFQGPVQSQVWTTPKLKRGPWTFRYEITHPISVTLVGPAVSSTTQYFFGAPPWPTSIAFAVTPGGVAPENGPPGWLGYVEGESVLDGNGVLVARPFSAVTDPAQLLTESCIYNLQYGSRCCARQTICDLTEFEWNQAGYTQATPRILSIEVRNDGAGTPVASDVPNVYIDSGIPEYSTFRFSGYWGDWAP